MRRFPHYRRYLTAALAVALLQHCPLDAPGVSLAASTSRLVRKDAVASRASGGEAWTIGAAGTPLAVGFARDGSLVIDGLGEAMAAALAADVADAPIVIDGHEVVLGDREDEGVHFAGDRIEDYHGGVRLSLVFNVPGVQARVLRHFVAYPGAPVIETWFEVERLDADAPVVASSIAAWRLGALGRDLHWRRGLLMGQDPDLAFTEQVETLSDGESVSFGSAGRASETVLPWVEVPTPGGTLFGGLLWSGAWRIEARGDAEGTQVTARLDDVETEVPRDRSLDGVHGFFGVVPGGRAEVAEAMRAFLVDGLRGGRGFPALVTYNTWFVHGVDIDDGVVAREAAQAAALGVEVFQLDAGWYTNDGHTNCFDFTDGLGSAAPRRLALLRREHHRSRAHRHIPWRGARARWVRAAGFAHYRRQGGADRARPGHSCHARPRETPVIACAAPCRAQQRMQLQASPPPPG